jgi:hypothetical protein
MAPSHKLSLRRIACNPGSRHFTNPLSGIMKTIDNMQKNIGKKGRNASQLELIFEKRHGQ